MPEMIIPKSSHDRFCLKKLSPNAPSTITNPPTSLERRACETTFHASFLISVSQPAAASQQQPASCSQPAKPASQASQPSQPANVASGHRSLRPPAIRHRCLQTLNKGHPIGLHRLPQAATARQTFWHPQHQGGSQTCHKPIKYRRYGQRTTLGRPFQAFRAPTKIL